MLIDVAESDALAVYQALVGVVTPRPIAWVTSVDLQGRVNLAPFSFYNTFGGDPPVVVFSPNRRPGGGKKDTLRNIEETGEFVINAAVAELAEQVNLSSTGLPPGESEVELTGLTAIPSLKIKPPRIQIVVQFAKVLEKSCRKVSFCKTASHLNKRPPPIIPTGRIRFHR